MTPVTLPSWLAPVIVDDLIRLGGDADGGYVVPALLVEGADCLISLGLGFNWQFEMDFYALHPEARIDVYDHERSEAEFLREYRTHLASAALGQTNWKTVKSVEHRLDSYQQFFSQPNVTHFPERVQKRPWRHDVETPHQKRTRPDDNCIDLIFCRATNTTFLSMDIEGEEWNVFEDVLIHSKRPIGMVVEFHDVPAHASDFERLIAQASEHYVIAHVHGNNFLPPGEALELTFGRKDWIKGTEKRTTLPLDIDRPNNPELPDHTLVFA